MAKETGVSNVSRLDSRWFNHNVLCLHLNISVLLLNSFWMIVYRKKVFVASASVANNSNLSHSLSTIIFFYIESVFVTVCTHFACIPVQL